MSEPELQEEENSCDYYSPSQHDFMCTVLPRWYSDFADVTIKTEILRIPDDVLQYLRSDIMRLPLNTTSSSFRNIHSSNESLDSNISFDGERPTGPALLNELSSDDDEDISENPEVDFKNFEDFDQQIQHAIDSLGGSVFPKLNWKSPKDAMWIAFNRSLRSFLPGDIYLPLKSSTNAYNVLHEPFKDCLNGDRAPCEYYLCLRQWTDLDPATEFRCFVHENRLICISQRETSGGYEKIPAQRDAIIEDIHNFFVTRVHGKFPLENFVFDVARVKPGKVILIDFDVFGVPTDALLFTYREIKMMADEMNSRLQDKDSEFFLPSVEVYGDPHFRFIGEHGRILPITSRKLT